MSNEQRRGPVMIAATSMLRPPPARISKITENVVLPRSVPVVSFVAGLVGAVTGLVFTVLFLSWIIGVGLTQLFVGTAVGAMLGVMTVTWSPLRGESLAMWLGLNVLKLRQDRVEINGRPVRAYIGVSPLHRTAVGRLRLLPSAVEVAAGSVDERGVVIPHNERIRTAVEALGLQQRLPGVDDGFALPRSLGVDDAFAPAFPAAPTMTPEDHDARLVDETWGWGPGSRLGVEQVISEAAPEHPPIATVSPVPSREASTAEQDLLPWEIAGAADETTGSDPTR